MSTGTLRTEEDHLAGVHKTSMTQEVRKELVRVLIIMHTLGETTPTKLLEHVQTLAGMTDRQLHLTWLMECQYITRPVYDREFMACTGRGL